MSETVFHRGGWHPRVIRDEGVFWLEIAGGADALGDARWFTVQLTEDHVTAIQDSLPRQWMLYSALQPLCDAAGVQGPLDERAAKAFLDPILFGSQTEVDALFRRIRWHKRLLISHGASVELLDRGQVFDASWSATEERDWERVRQYEANRNGPVRRRPWWHFHRGKGGVGR